MVQIAGKYKRTKAENWEEFLDKIGTRKASNNLDKLKWWSR